MSFTRQRSEAAAAAASASSSSAPNPHSEHGGSNPPTRKLRSHTSRTSRFVTNAAPAAPTAPVAPVARAVALPVAPAVAAGLVLKKSSRFRGVTKHRVTARFEAHLWDKGAYNVKQKKKGRQVYLGAYDDEISAAQAYDLAALKYWGPTTVINFQVENYTQQLKEMKETSRSEFLAALRRKSNGFSRGLSKFRGVARHHQNGRWEARIGRVEGNKYLYLGTYGTQEEAAKAYDKAAIKYRGTTAVTNFELSHYPREVEAAQGPKNKTSKNSLKGNQISKTIEGHLPSDLQTIKNVTQNVTQTLDNLTQSFVNVMQSLDRGQNLSTTDTVTQSLDGGQNLSTTNTITPWIDASLDAITLESLDNCHTSKFQDPVFGSVGETSSLNNIALKNAKQGEFLDHIALANDLNMDLGFEYDDILVGFNFPGAIPILEFEPNG